MVEFKEEWSARRGLSSGRRPDDNRTEYSVDQGRIIHSAAFRRLQGKTQVLVPGESDFYRTRLTHSVEVAQIATGIIERLSSQSAHHSLFDRDNLSTPLITAVAMAHDIGHPPFGHGGEVALNYMMRNLEEGGGGFEGNAQSLRIVSRLEPRIQDHGLDLTRRTLLGILKYPIRHSELLRAGGCQRGAEGLGNFRTVDPEDWKPPKCYFDEEAGLIEWILSPLSQGDRERLGETDTRSSLKPLHKSLDSSIMEIADDIGYGIHDFEDAIHMGLISRKDLEDSGVFQQLRAFDPGWLRRFELLDLEAQLFPKDKSDIKQTIGALVHACIASTELKEHEGFEHPLLRFRAKLDAEVERLLEGFKDLVLKRVIQSPEVQSFEYRGQQIIMEIFQALHGNPKRLLPRDFQERLEQDGASRERVICDYIAGMTDEYATKIYERLFMPRQGSLFQKL